jgi:small subunit ribosomal protein S5
MTDEIITKEKEEGKTTETTPKTNTVSDNTKTSSAPNNDFRKNRRKPRRRFQKEKPEFEQKILDIRRVTRVASGGRRFSFSVIMALGDKKGKVGVGVGKASDTALAIEKAIKQGKKNMFRITTTETMSIPHEVKAKYVGSNILMIPAPGRGIIAGGAPRDILALAGLNDINTKLLSRSKNHLNNARATVKALQTLVGEPAPLKKVEDKKTAKKVAKPVTKTDK